MLRAIASGDSWVDSKESFDLFDQLGREGLLAVAPGNSPETPKAPVREGNRVSVRGVWVLSPRGVAMLEERDRG